MIRRAIAEIPKELAHKCSYGLRGGGKHVSMNVMNYLLFRAPAYTDRGGKPEKYHFFVIYPTSMRVKELLPNVDVTAREVHAFAYFDCINVGLNFDEFASLPKQQWNQFKEACRMAANARRTREQVSNIRL